MASQAFNDAMENPQHMVIYAKGRNINGYFCDPKLDRTTLPDGWHAYDLRYDDDGCGIIVEICHNYVIVNNAGTFFTEEDITELSASGSSVNFEIDQEEWNMAHESDEPCPVSSEDDWGYSFG